MSFFSSEGESDSKLHIYKGSYIYSRHQNMYSEESFNVFKDRKDHTIIFRSSLFSRVATGELLTINVNYTVDKDYTPLHVSIDKLLGEDSVSEVYQYRQKDNQLIYTFTNKDGQETQSEMNTPPRFHIATPCAACSMLFMRSKKFDTTSKNIYHYWSCKNSWEHEEEPTSQNLAVQRLNSSTENIIIDGQNLQAAEYKVLHNVDEEDQAPDALPPEELRVYLSKHLTIPYMIKDQNGTKIQVKKLDHLE